MAADYAEAVGRALLLLAEVTKNAPAITPDRTLAWVGVLQAAGVPAAEIEPAALKLAQTSTFFPTPAEMLEAIRPTSDEAAELAWQAVLRAVQRVGRFGSLTPTDLDGDPATLWAVETVTWERLCNAEEDRRAITRAEFVRVWKAGRARGAQTQYLSGGHERENALHGLAAKAPALIGRPELAQLPPAAGMAATPPRKLSTGLLACCGARNRHLLTCPEFPAPRALAAGPVEGFAQAAEIDAQAIRDAEPARPWDTVDFDCDPAEAEEGDSDA
jgi:hypothetical protein